MTDQVVLPGSTRTAVLDAGCWAIDPAETVGFTVVFRRRAELPVALVQGRDAITVDELGTHYGC